MEPPIRVLFLCTANAARSQIAEALLRKKGGTLFRVASAGSSPAAAVRPEAVAALSEIGIDWSGRTPKAVDAVTDVEWDLVITLCDRMKETCPTLPGKPVFAHWGVPDPAEVQDDSRRRAAFQETLALIAWRLDLMLALRADALALLIDEQRLRHIGTLTPGAASAVAGELSNHS
ncbi:MAG TPA: arsenate reductase ArsC [Gemmatimonadaceae bacterium]